MRLGDGLFDRLSDEVRLRRMARLHEAEMTNEVMCPMCELRFSEVQTYAVQAQAHDGWEYLPETYKAAHERPPYPKDMCRGPRGAVCPLPAQFQSMME
jgi:hypothetical protein